MRTRLACSPGEGTPERTNARVPLPLASASRRPRLSTAFDSVTLVRRRSARTTLTFTARVGNSGVSIASVDDIKKLYSGFDLCAADDFRIDDDQRSRADDPRVLHECSDRPAGGVAPQGRRRMGGRAEENRRIFRRQASPGPMLAGCRPATTVSVSALLGISGDKLVDAETYAKHSREHTLKSSARHGAGGYPQRGPGAEHLHLLDRVCDEDDGRRPAVFHRSQGAANYYSVSISGYHIAEAGANPISQLAFTLSNGFHRSSSTTSRAA